MRELLKSLMPSRGTTSALSTMHAGLSRARAAKVSVVIPPRLTEKKRLQTRYSFSL